MSTISNTPDKQLPEIHLSEATAESTGDNNDEANDTFHSFGDETTPPHRNLSLIEAVSTKELELNTSEGPSQSTPVQVIGRQKYHQLSVKFLLTETMRNMFCSLKPFAN